MNYEVCAKSSLHGISLEMRSKTVWELKIPENTTAVGSSVIRGGGGVKINRKNGQKKNRPHASLLLLFII